MWLCAGVRLVAGPQAVRAAAFHATAAKNSSVSETVSHWWVEYAILVRWGAKWGQEGRVMCGVWVVMRGVVVLVVMA